MDLIIKNPNFYWYLAIFLSEAVEASQCYFLENKECISKIYHLRIPKLLSTKILLTYFTLSEPIHKTQFNVRYPVAQARNSVEKSYKMQQIQGISHWTVLFELAVTDWNMQAKSCFKVVLECWDDKFLIYILGFQKSNICWPPQPLTEKVLKFNMIFYEYIRKIKFFKTSI